MSSLIIVMIDAPHILSQPTLRGRPVIIRMWTQQDIPIVRERAIEIWRATYGSFIPDKDLVLFHQTLFSEERLLEYISSPDLCGFLAEVDGETVAFAKTYYAALESNFYLSSLYVLPGFQGMGIGKAMLTVSEDIGLAHGADEVWLGVMKQNEKALHWYMQLGFEFVREAPFMMGGTSVPHLIGFRTINRTLHE